MDAAAVAAGSYGEAQGVAAGADAPFVLVSYMEGRNLP